MPSNKQTNTKNKTKHKHNYICKGNTQNNDNEIDNKTTKHNQNTQT